MTDTTVIETHSLNAARELLARYGDAAWLLADAKRGVAIDAGPVIYLCDVPSGCTLLLETKQQGLQKLSQQAGINEASYQKIRDALSVLLSDLLDNTTGIHPDTRRGVILGAAFCITETRGFQITQHRGADVQHLLLRYFDEAHQQFVLTPMPLFKSHPIAAADLNGTATHVLISEHLNFPERFPSGKSLAFKETRRHVLVGKS